MFSGGDYNATYREVVLPDFVPISGDYHVICANIATTNNCKSDSSLNTDLMQNGVSSSSGMPNTVAIVQAVSGEIINTVICGGDASSYVEGSGVGPMDDPCAGTVGVSRHSNGVDTNQNNVDFKITPITPGAGNKLSGPEAQRNNNENIFYQKIKFGIIRRLFVFCYYQPCFRSDFGRG